MAGRDPNHIVPILCYNETTGLTEFARVDPATGYVLVYAVTPGASSPSALNTFLRDPNHVTARGAYNESTSLVEPVRCDSNGNILVYSV